MTTELTHRKEAPTPEAVTRQLRSLASSRNVKLSAGKRLKPIYSEDGAFLGNELLDEPVTAYGRPSDRQAVAVEIRQSLAPAPLGTIELWLAELSVIAPSKATDAMQAAMKLEAYSKRLAEYPGDAVRHVLLGMKWQFFPSWFEMAGELDRVVAERTALLRACEAPPPLPRPEPAPRERTTADRASEIVRQAGFSVRIPSAYRSGREDRSGE